MIAELRDIERHRDKHRLVLPGKGAAKRRFVQPDEAQHVVAGRFRADSPVQLAVVDRTPVPTHRRDAEAWAILYLYDLDGKEIWFHYRGEPVAKGLAKQDPLAAAKLYRSLSLRILNAGKSKYYAEALGHFEKARSLDGRVGELTEWAALIATVRADHSRKSGFLATFEQIVSGNYRRAPPFAEQEQARWRRLTS